MRNDSTHSSNDICPLDSQPPQLSSCSVPGIKLVRVTSCSQRPSHHQSSPDFPCRRTCKLPAINCPHPREDWFSFCFLISSRHSQTAFFPSRNFHLVGPWQSCLTRRTAPPSLTVRFIYRLTGWGRILWRSVFDCPRGRADCRRKSALKIEVTFRRDMLFRS